MNTPTARSDSLPYRLVEAIAEARGEEMTMLPPIADELDPDALEQLVESSSGPIRIELDIYGCTVMIGEDETVMVGRNQAG